MCYSYLNKKNYLNKKKREKTATAIKKRSDQHGIADISPRYMR